MLPAEAEERYWVSCFTKSGGISQLFKINASTISDQAILQTVKGAISVSINRAIRYLSAT